MKPRYLRSVRSLTVAAPSRAPGASPVTRRVRKLALAALILVATSSIYAADLGTGFTYQGLLKQGGHPIEGTADFRFTLWDAAGSGNPPTGGTQVGGVQAVNALPVTAGLFTVILNAGGEFGSDAFNGSTRWLQVAVRYPTILSDSFTTLAPRQPITATPYALRAAQGVGPPGFLELTPTGELILANRLVFDANNWTMAALTDEGTAPCTIESRSTNGDKTQLRLDDANNSVTIRGVVPDGNTAGITPPPKLVLRLMAAETNTAGITVGGGVSIAAYDYYGETAVPLRLQGKVGIGIDYPSERLDVAGNIHASGTITSGGTITIDGTSGSERISSSASLDFRTAAGRALRLENNATSPNLIGGYSGNTAGSSVVGATIGGGGQSGGPNVVDGEFGTVGGGTLNTASANSTVGGGIFNTASGGLSTIGGGNANEASGPYSTVGGGVGNTPSGGYGTVGGGFANNGSGEFSTIGGGYVNTASGGYSTVPGGSDNEAGGDYSFAGGRRARVRDPNATEDSDGDQGTFVWADASGGFFTSDGPNRFLVRASGGTKIYSNSALTAGVTLAAGGSAWAAVSDRNLKENFAEVNTRAILDRLAETPITTWNYKSQDDSIRHMGPMGQDFSSAFGIGEEETRITTIDADGVALAAIQGLYEIVQEKDCEIEELRRQNDREILELREKLAKLEALMNELTAKNAGGGQ